MKIRAQDCRIEIDSTGQIDRVEFYANGHLIFRGQTKRGEADHDWVYDQVFQKSPLNWSDFQKVKIIRS